MVNANIVSSLLIHKFSSQNFFSEGSGSGAAARLCVYIKNRRGALICISLRFYLYFVSTFPQSRRAAVSMAPLGWLSSLNLTGRYLLLFPPRPLFLPSAVMRPPPAGPVCSVLPRGRTEPQTGEFTLLVHNVDHSVVCCGDRVLAAHCSTVLVIFRTLDWSRSRD